MHPYATTRRTLRLPTFGDVASVKKPFRPTVNPLRKEGYEMA